MFILASKILLAVLASYVGMYVLLSVACYLSEHSGLVMLHMYFTPIILSGAFGLILILTCNEPVRKQEDGEREIIG